MKVTIYLPDALAAEVKAGLTETNISAVCQAALRAELEREKAMEKTGADGYQRVKLYDGKRGTRYRVPGPQDRQQRQGRRVADAEGDDRGLRPPRAGAVHLRRVRRVRR